jgi:hypothetical protein
LLAAQLWVAIISRIACGTTNLIKKKKKVKTVFICLDVDNCLVIQNADWFITASSDEIFKSKMPTPIQTHTPLSDRRGSLTESCFDMECVPTPNYLFQTKKGRRWQMIQMVILPILPLAALLIQSTVRLGKAASCVQRVQKWVDVLDVSIYSGHSIKEFVVKGLSNI